MEHHDHRPAQLPRAQRPHPGAHERGGVVLRAAERRHHVL